ncbi:cation transporter [Pseudarthrobacter sp. S9]|uniref:cation transporter n=1 Tax=Pseudarthrobacter sp. S9 TaxID=3418421 RepID=UPI003D0455FD
MTRDKSGSTSLTVIIAFVANVLVALAKTGAALIAGSASMTAEAAHSWADTGNQVFLLIAEKKAGGRVLHSGVPANPEGGTPT